MFKEDGQIISPQLQKQVLEAESNYLLKKNDFLSIEVYTNKGELIIDPNNELLESNKMNQRENRRVPKYLVQHDGLVKLPIIGTLKLEGLTLGQAENLLEKEYSKFYKDAFVVAKYTNKRIIVLGGLGGMVLPLENENTNLLEVLALAGGFNKDAKANNIRLLRGDLDDPEIYLIDLSTVEGMKQSMVPVQPGDVIYVEPVRRVVSESLKDITPVLSILTSTLTLIILIIQL